MNITTLIVIIVILSVTQVVVLGMILWFVNRHMKSQQDAIQSLALKVKAADPSEYGRYTDTEGGEQKQNTEEDEPDDLGTSSWQVDGF